MRDLVSKHHLPVLAANLVCGGERPFPGGVVLEQGGRKIGVVGITLGEVDACEVTDPEAAIREAVAALGEVDVTIGLLPYESDRTAAEIWNKPLPLQIAIDARGRAPAVSDKHADTFFVSGGSRGKHVGLLDLSFVSRGTPWLADGGEDELRRQIETSNKRLEEVQAKLTSSDLQSNDAALQRLRKQEDAYRASVKKAQDQLDAIAKAPPSNRFSITSVELGAEIRDHEPTSQLVEAAKAAITALVPEDPGRFVPRIVKTEGSPFAGGEACVGCHSAEHAQWSTTGHARAWTSLVADGRAMDSDCYRCHVTGAGAEGGPTSPASTAGFRDVQCEACHGPGREHIADPKAKEKVVRSPTPETCTTCHDGQQDGGRFDPSSYRPKVTHTAAVSSPGGSP